jgi:hypothetical protein
VAVVSCADGSRLIQHHYLVQNAAHDHASENCFGTLTGLTDNTKNQSGAKNPFLILVIPRNAGLLNQMYKKYFL